MAAVPGETTCSLNGCGVRSNMRRFTCAPMTAWPRRAVRSATIWPSITARDLTRVWAAARRTKPISVAWHWRRPHDVRRCCGASLWSGYALPTRRPTAAIDGDSGQGNHLSEPKRCSDKPGHLMVILFSMLPVRLSKPRRSALSDLLCSTVERRWPIVAVSILSVLLCSSAERRCSIAAVRALRLSNESLTDSPP